jgi:hypothetical protein
MAGIKQNDTQQSVLQLAGENRYDKKVKADPFWYQEDIDVSRWDKSYPYQLLVLKKDGKRYVRDEKWVYTLPIPPEALSISTPYAITTSLTLGGVVEEHNGAPIKIITLNGTTGVLPLRGNNNQLRTFNPLESIFAGTIGALQQTGLAALELGNVFDPNTSNFVTNLVKESEVTKDTEIGKTTGYYQFRLLERFLENYVNLKKTKDGKDRRLALAIWKDQGVYLVTPISFDLRRSASSPWEYNYSMQFKAWKRVHLDGPGALRDIYEPVARDVNRFNQLLNAVESARRVLQGLKATIQAIRGDINTAIFEPLREVALFCKDALGVALAFSDLPINIVQDARSAILEYVSVKEGGAQVAAQFRDKDTRTVNAFNELVELGAGLLKSKTRGGDDIEVKRFALTTDAANDVFEHPEEYYEFYNTLRPGDLNLSPNTIKDMVTERERVQDMTRKDFETIRDNVIQLLADFSESVGAGHATYTEVYNRPVVTTDRTPTDEDFDVMYALNQLGIELNRLAASGQTDQFKITTMEFMAGMARQSGIAFRVPRSKFAVPFPYGFTLERLALQYLGNPDRWHELAALNGLSAPYVDEEGFTLPLLVNGSANRIMVSDASNLYVGQGVWLASKTALKSRRHITSIRKLSSTQIVLELDGEPDLEQYKVTAQAILHAFLPDTVNSQQLIYIPSDTEPNDEDFQTKAIPGLDEFDQYLHVGGVDLLLTSTGDAAITNDGDWRLSVGLTNIIQKAWIRTNLKKNSLLHHPEIGLDVKPGQSLADLSPDKLLESVKDLFADDPTFTGVSGVAIDQRGPGVNIGFGLNISGVKQVIPVTFEVKQ